MGDPQGSLHQTGMVVTSDQNWRDFNCSCSAVRFDLTYFRLYSQASDGLRETRGCILSLEPVLAQIATVYCTDSSTWNSREVLAQCARPGFWFEAENAASSSSLTNHHWLDYVPEVCQVKSDCRTRTIEITILGSQETLQGIIGTWRDRVARVRTIPVF